VKILIVKLSSLGDVLHNLPIVWDLRAEYPDAQIDWVVEEAYVDLLKPLVSHEGFRGVDQILQVGFRRVKKNWKKQSLFKTLKELKYQINGLQHSSYDLVIDTQGLLKSAIITAVVKKNKRAIVVGLGNKTEGSGYEPIARWFYTQSVQLPSQTHAVDRSRALVAAAISKSFPIRALNPPQFYSDTYQQQLENLPNPLGLEKRTYVMFFHATAKHSKSWALDHWVELGKWLSLKNLRVVLPWGNESEKMISHQLAQEIPNAIVPDAFTINQAAIINLQSVYVIGVDTGLTHLAAVLSHPTIEIYVDSPKWKTEGYWSPNIQNLGDKRSPPTVEEVQKAMTF
jgi:heptosyltransferase-1